MIIKTNLLNPVSSAKCVLRKNIFLTIQDSLIINISEFSAPNEAYVDFSDKICIPGLIDLHVHLSQYKAMGKFSNNLLDWLNKYIFAAELKSADFNYALQLAELFYQELLAKGTTTSVVYVARFKDACEAAFQVAEKMGVRSVIGKTMMDINSPAFLQEKTEASLRDSIELFEKWNRKTSLLEYIFSPRFVPVCSSELMRKTAKYARDNNAYIQTHLSENLNEINWVKNLFPASDNYTQVYNNHDLLYQKTILGHCIHLNGQEIDLIRKNNAKIAHCPDSNFFLRSGSFPYKKIEKNRIDFGLASDVAAGTSLSMFNSMKMAIYRQDKDVITPAEVFYRATLGNAFCLGKEDSLGSVETGKEADLVFIDVKDINDKSADELISNLVFTGQEKTVSKVFIGGKQVFSQ